MKISISNFKVFAMVFVEVLANYLYYLHTPLFKTTQYMVLLKHDYNRCCVFVCFGLLHTYGFNIIKECTWAT
jgi:hypothetical protein